MLIKKMSALKIPVAVRFGIIMMVFPDVTTFPPGCHIGLSTWFQSSTKPTKSFVENYIQHKLFFNCQNCQLQFQLRHQNSQ